MGKYRYIVAGKTPNEDIAPISGDIDHFSVHKMAYFDYEEGSMV